MRRLGQASYYPLPSLKLVGLKKLGPNLPYLPTLWAFKVKTALILWAF